MAELPKDISFGEFGFFVLGEDLLLSISDSLLQAFLYGRNNRVSDLLINSDLILLPKGGD